MTTKTKIVKKKKNITFTIKKDNRDEIYGEIDRYMREGKELPDWLLFEAHKADVWESMQRDQ